MQNLSICGSKKAFLFPTIGVVVAFFFLLLVESFADTRTTTSQRSDESVQTTQEEEELLKKTDASQPSGSQKRLQETDQTLKKKKVLTVPENKTFKKSDVPAKPGAGTTSPQQVQHQEPMVLMKKPKLEIQLQYGDFEKYGDHWTGQTPMPVFFRWQHEITGVNSVSYEVRRLGQGSSVPALEIGSVPNIPDPGSASLFTIDLNHLVGGNQTRPLDYTVRLNFYSSNLQEKTWKKIIDSNAVRLTLLPQDAGTQSINLPQLKVTIDRIEIVDDSDDLSDGEFGFAFWLTSASANSTYQYYNGSAGSGDNLFPTIFLSLENPPQYVKLHAYGFDDDETDMMPLGPFLIFMASECGTKADPNAPPSGDCPGDTAEGAFTLNTGTASAVQKEREKFSFDVPGNSLHFRIYGEYEVTVY